MEKKTIDISHLTTEQKLAFTMMKELEFDEEGNNLLKTEKNNGVIRILKTEKNNEIIRIVRDDLHLDVIEFYMLLRMLTE